MGNMTKHQRRRYTNDADTPLALKSSLLFMCWHWYQLLQELCIMFNQLAEFYKAYSDWVDAGAPESEPFSRRVGLCGSLCLYLTSKGCEFPVRDMELQLMKSQFIKAGLSRDYPFNNAENSYRLESINAAIHTNSNRIAWVKKEWQHYV